MLAAMCAVTYGLADYSGGRASRSVASTLVTLIGQSVSLVMVLVVVLLIGTPVASAHDLLWGAAAGAAGGFALIAFYRAPGERGNDRGWRRSRQSSVRCCP